MNDMSENAISLLIERLKNLEYSIRKSITVREDQEEDAEHQDKEEAAHYGISSDTSTTKGDLLNAVQTALRSAETTAGKNRNKE